MCGGGGGGGDGTSGGMSGAGTVGEAMGGTEGLGLTGSTGYGGIGYGGIGGTGVQMSPAALATQQQAMSQMAMSELGNPPSPTGISDASTIASLFGVQPQSLQEQGISNTLGKGAVGLALGQMGLGPIATGLSNALGNAVSSGLASGQIGTDVGMAAGLGAAPGGIGGADSGVPTLANLTQGMAYTPMAKNTQPSAFQNSPTGSLSAGISTGQPAAPTIEQVTNSMYSIPSPKMNIANLMATRGVRGAGTKTARPEWFQKGRRL